jgi:hypothetical protein
MTTETRSHNWPLIVIVVLLGLLAVAIFSALDSKRKLKETEALLGDADSVNYHVSREIMKENALLHERSDSAFEMHARLREDVLAWVVRAGNAWDKEKNGYLRQIAKISTARYTVRALDSAQLALYGTPPDDSVHTIPLDYSRKLTGDALRMPIEQRLATRAGEVADSVKGRYIQVVNSYEVDLETARRVIKADEEALNGIMRQVGDMQGQLNEKDRKFRRQRRKERIVGGLIVVGVVILAL